jgi:hypothetical protein
MKNNQIDKLESLVCKGFQSESKFTPPENWQDKVITDIRRHEFNIQRQSILQPRLVWRFALASLAVATLTCLTLYLTVQNTSANDYQTNEVSFDNFDNYIEIIEQP